MYLNISTWAWLFRRQTLVYYKLIFFLLRNFTCKFGCRIRQWSTTNWHFEAWFNITLKNNAIRCKKLATIVSGQKNVAQPFVGEIKVNMSAKIQQVLFVVRCCYISALVITFFHLTKGLATFFYPNELLQVSCIFG